nr:hypothetical protein GCM10017611_00550 [Rhodococcus wratislaviensis]
MIPEINKIIAGGEDATRSGNDYDAYCGISVGLHNALGQRNVSRNIEGVAFGRSIYCQYANAGFDTIGKKGHLIPCESGRTNAAS